MSRLFSALVLAALVSLSTSQSASAQYPGFGGFCNPFFGGGGLYYGSGSYRTPPYFAVHPPVYYGARYARPYGMSPFAAPPMVTAPKSYRGRLESDFVDPPQFAPPAPSCNPCIHHSTVFTAQKAKRQGPVRSNPFVKDREMVDQIARKD